MAIETLKVANNWFGHLVRDMGGPKALLVAIWVSRDFSFFIERDFLHANKKNISLPQIVNDLYVKQKFDMRLELAVLNELGRQAIPVIIGEVFVRGFYFIRHLVEEVKEHSNLNEVDWHKVIPFGNRTIARMITISSGTFMAVDMADEAIRSAVKSRGFASSAFLSNMIPMVNFGVGRLAIASGTDVGMGSNLGQIFFRNLTGDYKIKG